jgi:polyhydroxyalkanoate synthesis regulator phasin
MDKRKVWRDQEQQLVARWNAANERFRVAHAQIAQLQPAADDAVMREADAARAELELLRRQVARLKGEFNTGKRY